MAFLTSSGGAILRPEEVAALIIQPVQELSAALQVTSVLSTMSHEMRIPIVKSDVSSSWTPEGSDITAQDPTVDELVVVPKKLAALTLISNEQANDTTPGAVQLVGDSIARDLSRKIDAAFFGVSVLNGPNGIAGVADVNVIDTAGNPTIDDFVDAEYAILAAGAHVTSWCCNAATARDLAKLKKFTGTDVTSSEPLLQPDPTQAGRRTISGVPLVVVFGTAIPDGEVWGIDASRVISVLRDGATLAVDASFAFGKDSVAVRTTIRVGFGFPHGKAIAHLADLGS